MAAIKERRYFWQVWRPREVSVVERIHQIEEDNVSAHTQLTDTPTPKGRSVSISSVLQKLRSTVLRAAGFATRGSFEASEWDLVQVQNAVQTESILRRAIEKYVEQIWKNGFEFVGQNPKTTKYIRRRFEQIAQVTGKTTMELFQEISYSLVVYANAFVIKQRNMKASGGRKRVTFDNKLRVPVAGYRVVDPTSMWFDGDRFGNVYRWKQVIAGMEQSSFFHVSKETAKEWPPYNVIHFQDRTATPSKYFFAMPMAVPVIPDIKALRETEELSLLQAIKFAIPRYHGKVGEKDKPGTQPELDALADLIDTLPHDAVLVTSSRAEIANISRNDSVLELEPYLEYWRQRILTGLGMSDVGMGRGESSSKATAQVLSAEMQYTTVKFQQIIKKTIEEEMIKELLFEAGYTPETLGIEDMVRLHVPEIDLEEKIRREAHSLNLYLTNGITQDELRKELGRDIVSEEEQKLMYLHLVQIPLAQAKANLLSPGENSASNKAQPENQYGKSLVKPRITKEEYMSLWEDVAQYEEEKAIIHTITTSPILNDYTEMRDHLVTHLREALRHNGIMPSHVVNLVFQTLEPHLTEEY